MENLYKGTDKEGRIRLGYQFSNKHYQMCHLKDDSILLLPVKAASNKEVYAALERCLKKHRETLDALQ